ncbi:uncharacterized protein DUF115 [Mobilisporobacter senegalensis]|uniref:Uncharacterized protein DUF115 n=1 Tax=Mobilisporobacter senegalensis TaxID=1329262 RepID=A0A3N1XY69_9FIRM|nr:6-hydroxymethylpterin diphosphokinase MptE-like protein [Mobilisporobacter senegalensis]ROR31530.1 uncharacterized protein DUF115 [Mobilisporobacter senegalensis]
MLENIREIFIKNIKLLGYTDKTITYLRLQNFYQALIYSTKSIETILEVIENILNNEIYFNDGINIVDAVNINQMLGDLLEAQENRDYILLADLYEMQLNPFVLSLQEMIISKETFTLDQSLYKKNIELILKKDFQLGEKLKKLDSPLTLLEEGYSVEYTSCGLMTLALFDNGKKYYLHSNGQILHEAGMLAREWFSNNISRYTVYGLGLGHHIIELMELDDSINITVYESDINVILLACAFVDLRQMISSDRVNLIYDPSFEKLSTCIKDLDAENRYIIHYPSLRNIKNINIREQLEDYFISYSSVNNQLHKLNNNFKKNIKIYDGYIESLKEMFKGKDLYIIAAGPSLDKNYKELKNLGKDVIILATGTVLKKLLSVGITPHYVIIIDANDGVYTQIKDINTKNIPLLYLSTVYYKIPEDYLGEKYLICQEGYKKAEEFASEHNYHLYQTGGSVSTTALDLGIQFECKRIIFLGLDLAYTNNQDHASGTASFNTVESNDLRQVEDIYGNMVGTSKNLDIYRKWIERRIKEVKNIEFIDATEGGAKIKGMKIKKLSECL